MYVLWQHHSGDRIGGSCETEVNSEGWFYFSTGRANTLWVRVICDFWGKVLVAVKGHFLLVHGAVHIFLGAREEDSKNYY